MRQLPGDFSRKLVRYIQIKNIFKTAFAEYGRLCLNLIS
jgi:hypothetical protein